MPEIMTKAGVISYEEAGSGQPLLLLHANLHCRRDFDLIVPRLSQRFRTITLDWPGHGESQLPSLPDTITATTMADTLEELAQQWQLQRAFIIGSSIGGFAAARLAIRQPQRVGAMVLVNSGGFTPHNFVSRTVCKLLSKKWIARRLMNWLTKTYVAPQTETDKEVIARVRDFAKDPVRLAMFCSIWRSFIQPESDLRAQAAAIKTPTLVVCGRRDPTAPVAYSQLIQKLIMQSHLAELEAGHLPFVSRPDEFLRVVEPFLVGVRGSDSRSIIG